jgi:steroid 5-alpha reductase family enzyme
MDALPLPLLTLAVTVGAMLALWLLSLALRDVSIVDIFWGLGFVMIAWLGWSTGSSGDPERRLLSTAIVTVWGVRLGGYLLWRNWGEEEDPRYQAMRRHYGGRFPLVSLAIVFGLQAGLMWTVSLPVQVVHIGSGPPLGPLDALGTALAAVGLFFESVGDVQLAHFRSDPANAGRVMDRGLWRYTRHPNYFGDCCVWWGLFLVALPTTWGWLSVVGPLLMTFLLLRVSGVAMLERSIGKRRPEYAAYVERTSAFFPRPPRRL